MTLSLPAIGPIRIKMSQDRPLERAESTGLAPILIGANTVAFALSFAVWVIFGPSIRTIAKEMHISLFAATSIKTLPVLIGAVMRIPIGILADRIGARLTFPILMLTTAASVCGLSFAASTTQLMAGALAMGFIGATFAVGVQSVSSWTPKAQRGYALGIFGAGNVGTSLTTFGLPLLLASVGWRASFRFYGLILAVAAATYWLLVRDAARPGGPLELKALLAPLNSARTWRLGLYYMATFGVFVATTLTISDIYVDTYHMSIKTAGLLATTFTFAASLCRIPGGYLADKFGARQVTRLSLTTIFCCLTPVCFGLPLVLTVSLVFTAGIAMGVGMASVFRYIPDYFPDTVGAVGGAVGALGGVGGFLLPQLGSAMKSAFGSPLVQVIPLANVAAIAWFVQYQVVRRINGQATVPGVAGLAALQSAIGESHDAVTLPAEKTTPVAESEVTW